MIDQSTVEILLVEDNPHDAEMAIRALKKNNLVNSVGAQIAEAWAKRRYEKHSVSKLTDNGGKV